MEILSRLGDGGMGQVYKARDRRLDRIVAVKMLHPDQEEESTSLYYFNREARASSKLSHPNIIQILDFGVEDDGTRYLVMEYIPGLSLADVIEQDFPLGPRRVANIIAQLLAALEAAHAQSIVHRDLKPENIMLRDVPGNPDFVKVLDFGIAKAIDHTQSVGPITQRGLLMGTPHFMSPEQILGHGVDVRSDLYSVGAILYQILTALLPFEGQKAIHVLARVVSEKPVPPSQRAPEVDIDPHLEQMCMRALRKNPDSRYQTATDFRVNLLSIMEKIGEGKARARPKPRNAPRIAQIGHQDLQAIRHHTNDVRSESVFDFEDNRFAAEMNCVTPTVCLVSVKLDDDFEPPAPLTRAQVITFVEHTLRRFSGLCADLGEGEIIALFGYPRPLDDSNAHGLQAAQAIFETLHDERLRKQTRIGLSFGEVKISGEDASTVEGTTLQLVREIVRKAPPGKIVADGSLRLTESTVQLLPTSISYLFTPSFTSQRPPSEVSQSPQLPLLGREKERELLENALESACNGESAGVCFVGVEGVGKTRLLGYAMRLAEAKQMAVVEVFAERFPNVRPGLILRRLLYKLLDIVPVNSRDAAFRALALPSQHVAILEGLLNETPPTHPEYWADSLAAAIVRMLRAIAKQQALLLTCDILGAVDNTSARVLVKMMSCLEGSSVAVVLSLRQLDSRFKGFEDTTLVRKLSTLSVTDVEGFLNDRFSFLSERVRAQMAQQSGGHPGQLRWLIEGIQAMDRPPDPLPPALASRALAQRLRMLPQAARKLAAYAAALGESFPMDVLNGSVPQRWKLRENIHLIGTAGLLMIFDDEDTTWLHFHPPSLALRALMTLPEETRRQINLLIARYYQRTRMKNSLPDHDYQWSRHLLAAGYHKDAVKMLALASDSALRMYGPAVAASLQGGLVEALGKAYANNSSQFQRLVLRAANVLVQAEQHEEALAAMDRIDMSVLEDTTIETELTLLRGRALAASGNRLAARRAFDEALKTASADQILLRAHIHLHRGLLYQGRGRSFDALQEALEASQLFGQHEGSLPKQHIALAWWPHKIIGQIHLQRHHHAKAASAFQTALDAAKKYSDTSNSAMLGASLAAALRAMDRSAEALSQYRDSIKLCNEVSDLPTLARCLHESATLELELGDRKASEAHFRESFDLALDLGWKDGVRLNEMWLKRF